jgi:hypothetical protein
MFKIKEIEMTNEEETPSLAPRLRPGGAGEVLLQWLTSEIEDLDSCMPMVHQLCRCEDRIEEVQAKILTQGLCVSAARGRSMANPLLSVEVKLLATYDKIWRSLGLADTPVEEKHPRPVGRPGRWTS